jgi:hypothetical protein
LIASRALAVLAAASFVAAFALATLFPPLSTLAQLVVWDDPGALTAMHSWLVTHVAPWAWDDLTVPLLLRPCWLAPVCLGILCAGGATTLASRAGMPRSHRRRS